MGNNESAAKATPRRGRVMLAILDAAVARDQEAGDPDGFLAGLQEAIRLLVDAGVEWQPVTKAGEEAMIAAIIEEVAFSAARAAGASCNGCGDCGFCLLFGDSPAGTQAGDTLQDVTRAIVAAVRPLITAAVQGNEVMS